MMGEGPRMCQFAYRVKVMLLLANPAEHAAKVGSPAKQHQSLQVWLQTPDSVKKQDRIPGEGVHGTVEYSSRSHHGPYTSTGRHQWMGRSWLKSQHELMIRASWEFLVED